MNVDLILFIIIGLLFLSVILNCIFNFFDSWYFVVATLIIAFLLLGRAIYFGVKIDSNLKKIEKEHEEFINNLQIIVYDDDGNKYISNVKIDDYSYNKGSNNFIVFIGEDTYIISAITKFNTNKEKFTLKINTFNNDFNKEWLTKTAEDNYN